MKKEGMIKKVCFLWTFLFFSVIVALAAPKTKPKTMNSFKSPDFAFPVEVRGNARVELQKSLKAGDGENALRAAMQVVIAENLISQENGKKGAQLIDSVSRLLPEPFSSLGKLLEAQLYYDIYNSDRWRYNGRSIPVSPVPDDVTEWSREMFSNKVTSLVSSAFDKIGGARQAGIGKIAGIITNSEDAIKSGLTVYDFMTIQGVNVLQPFVVNSNAEIPFFGGDANENKKNGTDASNLLNKILAGNMKWHEEVGPTESGSIMTSFYLNTLSYDSAEKELQDAVDKYYNSPWCGGFLLSLDRYTDDNGNKKRELYNRIRDYLKKFPECRNSKSLKNWLLNVEALDFNIVMPSQVLPDKKIEGNVSFSNIREFYLLALRVSDKALKDKINDEEILRGGAPAAYVKISSAEDQSSVPFNNQRKFEMPGLKSGVYVIVASKTPDRKGLLFTKGGSSYMSVMLVSRLSCFSAADSGENGGSSLYVTEGENGVPVEGATVSFIPTYRGGKWTTSTATTDKDGKVKNPGSKYSAEIRYKGDILNTFLYTYNHSNNKKEITAGSVFTDLSIYRPGDKIGFSAVAYTRKGYDLTPAIDQPMKVILVDANYQDRDTLNLQTDKFGRLNGEFILPPDGLLGSWNLRMSDGKNYITETMFEVAEYKSPTFFVTIGGTEGEIKIGDTVRIKGTVESYSGMPINGAEIKYSVRFVPCYWLRRFSGGNASYGGTTVAGKNGEYEIALPTANLANTRFAFGRYELTVTATNAAGETQSASPTYFSLGSAYRINPNIAELIEIGKEAQAKASVGVYDILDHPVVKPIYYQIISLPDSIEVTSGMFESGVFPLDFSKLSSGEYKAVFSLDKDMKDQDNNPNAETTFIVWRPSDKVPPVKTPLWVPQQRIVVGSDSPERLNVRIGSSYINSMVFAEFSDQDGVYDHRWIPVSEGMVEVPVKKPDENNRTRIIFTGVHDLKGEVKDVTIIPETQTKNVQIKAESFRDRLSPGAKEKYKFVFSLSDERLVGIPVMAVMSNKALNALAPFRWTFNPYASLPRQIPGSISRRNVCDISWNYDFSPHYNQSLSSIIYPDWETYGEGLFGLSQFRKFYSINVRGGAKQKAAAYDGLGEEYALQEASSFAGVVKNEMKYDVEAEVADLAEAPVTVTTDGTEGGINDNDKGNDEETLREIECPLVFFMPELVTDESGVATIDFDVPNFNGTWQLQVMGYTPEMRGGVMVYEAVSSKSVMVQMNAPRFVRTGDKINVAATIYNNRADAANLGGRIIIFNPLTGENYVALDEAPVLVPPMESRIISEEFTVPCNVNVIGIRVYGDGESSSDGEQTIVPVYPSSTPVIESAPFWLSPGQKKFKADIPENAAEGVTTLTYTDNPVWECVTALPSLFESDSQNVLSQIAGLYATATASGLIKKYPKLSDALKLFADPANRSDSTLMSNLKKNAALKAVALTNTPWVKDAQSQTLRMEKLIEYTDEKKSEKTVREISDRILSLQNRDGGWSWCDGMPSSRFITVRVMKNVAMLRKPGFIPDGWDKPSKKAISYIDSEIVKEWKKVGSNHFSYISLLDYLYIRSYFDKVSTSSDFDQIKRRSLKEIEREWKKMGIYDKATAANLLFREGRTATAGLILKSLEEYASESDEKGMWFDNLKSGYNGYGKLNTTAQVLEAWHQIEPSSPVIDKLRQWILLSKQVEDWGNSTVAADLVQSILDTGSDWAVQAAAPVIRVNGRIVEIDRVSQLTGSITLPLTGVKGQIEIERDAPGPAWGGIVNQFVAPIKDVTAVSIPQLSVEKNIYVITNDQSGTTASAAELKVGDRVRVTLTLKADRDLQYVAVTDSRSACLEPADQTSGYTSSDGVWMYRETRNSSTNLFIPFLSKGTHIVTYDCFVDREGEYSLGIATAQSQYAPVITAHSAGKIISVK